MRTALLSLTLLLVLGAPASAAEPGVADRELQKQIDAAIKKGAEYLVEVQKQSGLVGGVTHQGNMHYSMGTTALAGLALLASGEKPGDTAVDRILSYCKSKDAEQKAGGRTTYDAGVLLMFLTEYYRPQAKREKGGKPKKPGRYAKPKKPKKGKKGPCHLTPEAYAWVKDLARWLVSKQKEEGGWGYPTNREDFSNTQYALLGLRAARDCGVPIPPAVFLRAKNRALERQEQEGPKVLRTLEPTKAGGPVYKIDGGDRARGWSYTEDSNVSTGSMTTAGIAILAICHDALTKPKPFSMYKGKDQNVVTRSIQDGFAWLDVHFSVGRNPGIGAPAWHFYYLYGLERCAVFAGRNLVGKHDWYLEGARYLVNAQVGDGRWHTGALGGTDYEASDVIDTAWAILFLKRATRPMKPILPPVVTGN